MTAVAGLLPIARWATPYVCSQAQVAERVRTWLGEPGTSPSLQRLMAVYAVAGVEARSSALPIDEIFAGSDFESRNDRYAVVMIEAATAASREALALAGIDGTSIGLVTSVSCTGFMIPAVDAHVANALRLGPRLARLPITQSGCAGGAVGLARTVDFLSAHPTQAALLIAAEFPSLTFQRWDRSATNVISTALFGDGAAACVLVGRDHPRFAKAPVHWEHAASRFFPDSLPMMGFRLRNPGLQIILDKGLALFVRRHASEALATFLDDAAVSREELTRFALHPGGRKVIEGLASAWGLTAADLEATRRVLRERGNMSSVTVLHVLAEVLAERPAAGERGLLTAFGPGFGAELALLRFT